jgi:ribosomal protein S18 acetylase RimI-like enzyme
MNLQVRKADASQLKDIASFVARLQDDNAHHTGYFGTEAKLIEQYIMELEPIGPEAFLLAYEGNALIGLLGLEFDLELGRAWLHGPMVDHDDWQLVADELYESALKQVLPTQIKDLELYGDIANTNLRRFAQRKGFTIGSQAFTLCFPETQAKNLPTVNARELEPKYHDAFKSLHRENFPGTYYSGQQIINKIDGRNKVFIAVENGELLGFIYPEIDTGSNQGYLNFLGVKKSARRQGIATKLIIAAVQWLLSLDEIHEVRLTVSEENTGALKLYTNIGFELERTLQGYRKK